MGLPQLLVIGMAVMLIWAYYRRPHP